MYVKLAWRNAIRSIKDYLIYIVTLTICVALFYAFLSISSRYYQPDIGQEFNIEALGSWMKIAILLITLLLVFLVRYVNQFMFHRRQKEFAVQSIMGMEQSLTGWIFFLETFVMGLLALAAGIFLGTVCSQFITAMLLNMFQRPFRFSFMLFPDTVLLTAVFFCLCFAVTGLFQVRAIRKTKIITMLHGERENEDSTGSDQWIRKIIVIHLIVHLVMGVYGVRTLTYYFTSRFSGSIRFWCLVCMAAPWMMLLAGALYRFFGKRKSLSRYLCTAGILSVLETLVVGLLPLLKTRYSLPMDTGAFNSYIAFLIWCVVFIICAFFFLFSRWLAYLKRNSISLRYREENLFFLGQILSKLKTNTKNMAMICLTLTVSITLFLLTPALAGWAQGYLEKRTPYDIQMYSGFAKADSITDLTQADYRLMNPLLEEYGIQITDDCCFQTYFIKETDLDDPIMAVSLTDYNHLARMLGYGQLQLAHNEFATQWISTINEERIQSFMAEHSTLSTDAGTLRLSGMEPLKYELGETIYGYQNVIYIVPDIVCDRLSSANTFRYLKTGEPISYAASAEIEKQFHGLYSGIEGATYYGIETSTQQINNTSLAIYVMQTVLIYCAIVLFVICFTILALQQLYDAGKYKYRFQVLKNMGVEETHIHRLVRKQLALWFGLPVCLAIVLAGIFFLYLMFSFSAQLTVYIGVGKLLRQVVVTLSILVVLLTSYYVSTLTLFERSVSN